MDFEIRARSVGRRKIKPEDYLTFHYAEREHSDFSGRKLSQFAAVGSRFQQCQFDKMRIEPGAFGARRENSEYLDCTFDGSRITFGGGGYARFVRCSFRDVDLRDWYCFTVELVDCTFSGKLRHSWFNGTVPEEARQYARRERNEFRGNDFSQMDLIDVDFRTGIDLTQQRLPSGPQYVYLPDAVTALQRARTEVTVWEDPDLRREALIFINGLEEDVARGQRQLLLRPDIYFRPQRKVVAALFPLLRQYA